MNDETRMRDDEWPVSSPFELSYSFVIRHSPFVISP
jgi:hypothetical protein